ncbi:hypothetical protein EIN_407560 [Entamoeba invadens IP1]|uniref:Uncharacterized protein n=1 Tax=Entamoeba invadens IP1 TaxID=370355 RepID=A0A0A1TWI6_ENTIV|nr:hypothetical protein EIN_407560 [Entamoeba invadens IP1]ELP85557.1 hypothetical protein EIN_407560 [Entamoeba invadens IP1]|eukprot:XP_004184903.1 hypothetical protein EIN_407560 [Entamoeba invadens IP1]
MITTSNKDVLDDVLLYSYSDYLANDSLIVEGSESQPPTPLMQPQHVKVQQPPQPFSHSKPITIIRPSFANIVFSDYENSNESDEKLAAHFQRSFTHAFSASPLVRLEEWNKSQN